MPHLNNLYVVHRDINVTVIVGRGQGKIEAKVDVVVGGCWTCECRGVRIVGAACVSDHTRQRNGVTIARSLVAGSVSREANEICKSVICNV